MRNINLFLFVFAVITGCTHSGNEDIREQIEAQNKKLQQVISSKNINLLDEVYHPQAYFLAPDDTVVHGIKNIKAKWLSGLDAMAEMHSKTIEISGQGDVVSEIGIVETQIKIKDTSFVYKAKYNNVWQKDARGKYLLKVDIWNTINTQ